MNSKLFCLIWSSFSIISKINACFLIALFRCLRNMQMYMYIACKCRIAPPPSKLIQNYPRADAVHLGKMELSCSGEYGGIILHQFKVKKIPQVGNCTRKQDNIKDVFIGHFKFAVSGYRL